MADRYARATGNWADTSTWAATAGGSVGASVPGSNDSAIIDIANKVGGAGAITVTLTGDVEVEGLHMYSASDGVDATLHTASEHTVTINDYAISGYSAKIHGYTEITGNVNLTFTKAGAHTIIIDPTHQTNKVNDITVNHASNVLNCGSNVVIKGKLTVTAGRFNTNSATDGSGTTYNLTVGEEINLTGTLTANTAVVQAATMEINNNGTYDATSGTTTITAGSGGSTSGRCYWSHTGGTLKHNFGTFAFTDGSPQVEPGGPADPYDAVATSAHTFWNVTCSGGFLPKTQRMVIANNLTTVGDIGYNGNNYWLEVYGTWEHKAGSTNNSDTNTSSRVYARNFLLSGTGELDLKTTNITVGSLRNIGSGPITGVANQ